MSTVKAKLVCGRIEDTTYQSGSSRKVHFNAVYSDSPENKTFSKATPSASLEMIIDKETPAYNSFTPGKSYYLTFEEAPTQ